MADSRFIFGIIERNGEVIKGDGFSCRRKELGEYEVMFDPPLPRSPAVVATAEHDEEVPRKVLNVVIDNQTARMRHDGFVILIQTPDGEPNDNRFHFIVMTHDR